MYDLRRNDSHKNGDDSFTELVVFEVYIVLSTGPPGMPVL